jgi:hypothetical protein
LFCILPFCVLGQPLSLVVNVANASCGLSCDGQASVQISGGKAPYLISWSHGATGISADSLCSGAYDVVVLDADSALASASFTVVDSALFNAYGGVVRDDTCESGLGLISLNVQGSFQMPLSYQWTGPSGFSSADSVITNLYQGAYFVTVTDARGCSASNGIALNSVNAQFFAFGETIRDDTCGSGLGAISLNMQGDFQPPLAYSWTGPAGFSSTDSVITGLSEGAYFVVVTDARGCVTDNGIGLSNVEPQFLAYPGVLQDDTCGSGLGSISLSLQGDYRGPLSYSWTGPSGFSSTDSAIAELHEANYFVTVTDARGCTAENAFHLANRIPEIFAYSGTVQDDTCGSGWGYISLDLQGDLKAPLSYSWTGPAGFSSADSVIMGLHEGYYQVQVTDARGCETENGIVIQNHLPELYADGGTIRNDSCGLGLGFLSLDLKGDFRPPLSYRWKGPARFASTDSVLSGLFAGNYSVTVSDSRGCFAANTLRLTNDSTSCTSTTRLEKEQGWEGILVYPNPTANELWIDLRDRKTTGVMMSDLMGRVVRKESFNQYTSVFLNTRGLSTGTYTLWLEVNGQWLSRKISVVR